MSKLIKPMIVKPPTKSRIPKITNMNGARYQTNSAIANCNPQMNPTISITKTIPASNCIFSPPCGFMFE